MVLVTVITVVGPLMFWRARRGAAFALSKRERKTKKVESTGNLDMASIVSKGAFEGNAEPGSSGFSTIKERQAF